MGSSPTLSARLERYVSGYTGRLEGVSGLKNLRGFESHSFRTKAIKVKIENIRKYLDAVDDVCINCHYLNEKTCETCPVRKTCDDVYESNDYMVYLTYSNKLGS